MRHKYAKLVPQSRQLGRSDLPPLGSSGSAARGRRGARGSAGGRHRVRVRGGGDIAGRWAQWGVGGIEGRPRAGGSTWQSVARGAGSVETDYLNGEIVLLGRQFGVATPVNALLQHSRGRRSRAARPRLAAGGRRAVAALKPRRRAVETRWSERQRAAQEVVLGSERQVGHGHRQREEPVGRRRPDGSSVGAPAMRQRASMNSVSSSSMSSVPTVKIAGASHAGRRTAARCRDHGVLGVHRRAGTDREPVVIGPTARGSALPRAAGSASTPIRAPGVPARSRPDPGKRPAPFSRARPPTPRR